MTCAPVWDWTEEPQADGTTQRWIRIGCRCGEWIGKTVGSRRSGEDAWIQHIRGVFFGGQRR